MTAPTVGDLVDAEYIESIQNPSPAKLRGIVSHVGDWEGKPTYSVIGYDRHGSPSSTSSSTMPVHIIATGNSEAARSMLRTRYAESTGVVAERLERIAEEIGMSL